MEHFLSSIFLAVSSNVDNFAVGIAYGVKKIRIGILGNLVIASISAGGTYASMTVGAIISNYLSPNIANLLGSGVLVAIGIWSMWDAIQTEKQERRKKQKKQQSSDFSYNTFIEDPARADLDNSRIIDMRESVTLGFAVTINNVAGGIGGGISGINIIFTTLLTFILSLLGVAFGYFLGTKFAARMSGKWSGIASGCLIIGIGIYEYFH